MTHAAASCPARLRLAAAQDRLCRARRRLLHPWDFQRRWFRELARYYRHLSREEFWLRYHEGRRAAERAGDDPTLWQQTDYFVLRQAYYHRDRCWHLASALLPRGGTWLEVGCGIAPASAWLARHRPDARGDASDVPGRTQDYARWRLRGARVAVRWEPVGAEAHRYDLIVCSEVFEHLPDPLWSATTFVTALRPGGYLLANFVETEPHGANLAAAQTARTATLAFLAAQLEVIRPITANGPDGIARKRGATSCAGS